VRFMGNDGHVMSTGSALSEGAACVRVTVAIFLEEVCIMPLVTALRVQPTRYSIHSAPDMSPRVSRHADWSPWLPLIHCRPRRLLRAARS
jgi:hypothetical protein